MNAKKILAIFMCMLMLAIIPASLAIAKEANATPKADQDPQTTDIGRTVLRGFYFNMRQNGLGHRLFAFRVHFTTVTGTETSMGVLRFQPVEVGRWVSGYIREGPMGMFGYMAMATFQGGIDY